MIPMQQSDWSKCCNLTMLQNVYMVASLWVLYSYVCYILLCLLRAYYSQNVFGDRDTLQPHKGEMIAAYFAPEECWYRALVLDSTEKKIKVLVLKFITCIG